MTQARFNVIELLSNLDLILDPVVTKHLDLQDWEQLVQLPVVEIVEHYDDNDIKFKWDLFAEHINCLNKIDPFPNYLLCHNIVDLHELPDENFKLLLCSRLRVQCLYTFYFAPERKQGMLQLLAECPHQTPILVLDNDSWRISLEELKILFKYWRCS